MKIITGFKPQPGPQHHFLTCPADIVVYGGARVGLMGVLADAASRYRQVLQSEPDHAQALYHLAVIGCQQGQFQQGIELAS